MSYCQQRAWPRSFVIATKSAFVMVNHCILINNNHDIFQLITPSSSQSPACIGFIRGHKWNSGLTASVNISHWQLGEAVDIRRTYISSHIRSISLSLKVTLQVWSMYDHGSKVRYTCLQFASGRYHRLHGHLNPVIKRPLSSSWMCFFMLVVQVISKYRNLVNMWGGDSIYRPVLSSFST